MKRMPKSGKKPEPCRGGQKKIPVETGICSIDEINFLLSIKVFIFNYLK